MTDANSDLGRPLHGRVAVITGGSRGIGAATAVRLAGLGARVVITYRQAETEATAVVEECADLTPGARAIQMDLLDEQSVRATFAQLDENGLDLLIANAAATALKPLMDLKLHQIDKTFAMSVRHFLLMVQLAYPLLEKAGGRVIAISGADTVGYIPSHGLLAAAKAALETLVYYLSCELGPAGITVMGILPGYVDTDSIQMMTGPLYEGIKAGEAQTHPLREVASPSQVADALSLLCLSEAR
jgi:enoyl-[acyl-carrier protein] reductase III